MSGDWCLGNCCKGNGIMSILDKFDPYAMINPKTEEDFLALLDELHAEADNLTDILDRLTLDCERNKK